MRSSDKILKRSSYITIVSQSWCYNITSAKPRDSVYYYTTRECRRQKPSLLWFRYVHNITILSQWFRIAAAQWYRDKDDTISYMMHIIINGPRRPYILYYYYTHYAVRTMVEQNGTIAAGDVVWPVICCCSWSHVSRPINHNILLGAYYARLQRFYNDFLRSSKYAPRVYIHHYSYRIYIHNIIIYVPVPVYMLLL